MSKSSMPQGRTLTHAHCPIDGGSLRADFEIRTLTCAHCTLALTLSQEEADDLYMLEVWPSGTADPDHFMRTLLQAHHISGVLVPPDPQVISMRDWHGWKFRLVPQAGETPEQRAVRLADQAALNGVQVLPLNEELTEFTASSQRRTAEGRPVRWYEVRISPFGARCSCDASGLCAHLSAVHSWLTDLRVWEAEGRERERVAERITTEQRIRRGEAAIAELWG